MLSAAVAAAYGLAAIHTFLVLLPFLINFSTHNSQHKAYTYHCIYMYTCIRDKVMQATNSDSRAALPVPWNLLTTKLSQICGYIHYTTDLVGLALSNNLHDQASKYTGVVWKNPLLELFYK